VEYHAPRLDHYLEDVHQQLGTLQETIAALKDRELTEEESKTADLVKQFNILHLSRSSMRPREYASRMTRRAYVIRRNVMDRKIKPPEGLAKLFLAVDRLSKLRASYRTIVEVAAMLQSFDIVEITAKALPMETPTPMDFDAVLAHLGVPSGLRSSSRYLPDAMTKSEAKRRFKHLQEKELQSHPEVHLLIALLENQVNMTNFLPYMGVSKKSCYLCWSFLKAHGKFIPRGSHGKLYSKWMIPTTGMIDAREAENMCNAVKAVETDLRRRLKEKMGLKMDAAESTIGAFSPREDTRSIASALSPIAPKSHLSVGGAFTPRPSTPLGLFLAPLSPVARTITIHSEYNDSNRSEVGSKDSAISTISSDEGATTTARSVKLPSERPARAVTPNHIAASQHSGMRTPKPLSLKSGRSGSRTPKPPTVASLKSGKSALHSVRLISPMKAIRPLGSRKSIKSVPTTVGSVSTVTDEFMTRAWDCRYHDKKLCELLKAASGEVMHPVVRKALMKDTTKRIESLKKKYGVSDMPSILN
jgi:hypothetical protein